ncbi:MAG: chemotaxis protein CheW [Candidatus Dadabacteria bacterium]|nr:MAG: chemotaxis protein CheW [Candidatus Dadabacteria bacterium]
MPDAGERLARWRERLRAALDADAASEAGGPEERPGSRLEFLEVEAAGERYGFPVGSVAEILRSRPVTPVPRTPPWVLGVASLRGAMLPVVDLATRLGIGPGGEAPQERIVVVRDGDETMGFRVARVVGVVRLDPAHIRDGADEPFLAGMARDPEGRTLGILSPEELCAFRAEEAG